MDLRHGGPRGRERVKLGLRKLLFAGGIGQQPTLGIISQVPLTLLLDWVAGGSPRILLRHLPGAGVVNAHHCAGLLTWVLGVELWFLGLHIKHFID